MYFPTVILFLAVCTIICAEVKEKNICLDYFSYFFKDSSKNCYHSPDLYNEVPELNLRYTYVSETHYVPTQDGYNLTVFRIPRKNPKGVILLQHPLSADANMWVSQENMSLAFNLWYQNYDVWLPNNRGNYYCREHQYLKPTHSKFWDFSFHEIGMYDHKAVVDYMVEKTNRQLIFIGHSMAVASFLVYSSLRAEEANKKIKLMIFIAPTVYVKDSCKHLKQMSVLEPFLKPILKSLNIHSAYGQNDIMLNVISNFLIKTRMKKFFDYVYAMSHGSSLATYVDPRYITMILSQVPSEYSLKCNYHYFQLARAKDRFQMYDYGFKENLEVYGLPKPPLYPLENIMIPFFIIYSIHDDYSSIIDIELLVEKLVNAKNYGVHQLSKMNHMSYFYNRNTESQLYPLIYKALNLASNISEPE